MAQVHCRERAGMAVQRVNGTLCDAAWRKKKKKALSRSFLSLTLFLSYYFTTYASLFLFYFFTCIFSFFRAAPEAYGSSQARGGVRAAAASLHHSHSNAGSLTH